MCCADLLRVFGPGADTWEEVAEDAAARARPAVKAGGHGRAACTAVGRPGAGSQGAFYPYQRQEQ